MSSTMRMGWTFNKGDFSECGDMQGLLLRERSDVLKELCSRTGLLVLGNKPEIVNRIVQATNRTFPKSVVSIDVGYRNLAFACFKGRQLERWERLNLNFADKYEPSEFGSITRDVSKDLLQSHPEALFIIERQRARTMGGAGVLESNTPG